MAVHADLGALSRLVGRLREHGVVVLDSTGQVISWNGGAETITGYRQSEILGRDIGVCYTEQDRRAGLPRRHLEQATAGAPVTYTARRARRDGTEYWAEVELAAVVDDDGATVGYAEIFRDVTDREDARQDLARRSMQDPMTGLPNRRWLLDRVTAQPRPDGVSALVVVGIDRFKSIKECLGDAGANLLLAAVRDRIQEALGADVTVAKLAPDELGVLCSNVREDPAAQAQRLTAALDVAFPIGDEEVRLATGIGVAVAGPDPASSPEVLLLHASTAMHQARSQHPTTRNRFRIFEPVMGVRQERRVSLERSLQHALHRDELHLHYQPVIRLGTDTVESFEALLRWDSTHGPVSPSEFIPLAETTGLIRPIGAWVLEQALAQSAQWRNTHSNRPAPRISVNVSAHQLAHRGVLTLLDRTLAATGADPATVCLELTETQLMSDIDAALPALVELKRLGVLLAIDDFGTGYSSLSYLKRLPVDILKIDRSFIAGLTTTRHDPVIVGATIKMANSLGLRVIAEGVETNEQLSILHSLGCTYGQGWRFGRPQPPETVSDHWLK